MPAMLRRLATHLAVLALVACAADSDATGYVAQECAPRPDVAVFIRTELEGTCGPQPSLVSRRGAPTPATCTLEHDMAECFVWNSLVCASGLRREWWLDGKSGRWVGEERYQETVRGCESVYRIELDPR